MITCGGRRLPAVNSISRAMLKRKLNRDTAKPTIEARVSATITAGTVITIVLRKKWGRFAAFHAAVKLSSEIFDGQVRAFPDVMTSPYGRRALNSDQPRGRNHTITIEMRNRWRRIRRGFGGRPSLVTRGLSHAFVTVGGVVVAAVIRVRS